MTPYLRACGTITIIIIIIIITPEDAEQGKGPKKLSDIRDLSMSVLLAGSSRTLGTSLDRYISPGAGEQSGPLLDLHLA